MWLAVESRPEGTDSLYISGRDPGGPLARVGYGGQRGSEPDTVFSHRMKRRAGRDDGHSDVKPNVETGYQVQKYDTGEGPLQGGNRTWCHCDKVPRQGNGGRNSPICTGTMIRMSGGSWR